MRTILTILTFTICLTAISAELIVIGPCYKTPALSLKKELIPPTSVGEFTVQVLKENKISFVGSAQGINSILDTPTGRQSVEIIEGGYLAYGWCYSVDGEAPEVYPHLVSLSDNQQVTWWYGYATFKNGEWTTQCSPSYLRRSEQFCSNN